MDANCYIPNLVEKKIASQKYGLHCVDFDAELFQKYYINHIECDTVHYHINSKCLPINKCDSIDAAYPCNVRGKVCYDWTLYPDPEPGYQYVLHIITLPLNFQGKWTLTSSQFPGEYLITGTNIVTSDDTNDLQLWWRKAFPPAINNVITLTLEDDKGCVFSIYKRYFQLF